MAGQIYSFGAIPFQVISEGAFVPAQSREGIYSAVHVPGSNINIMDLGGLSEETVEWEILVLAADVIALQALRQTTATLLLGQSTYSDTVAGVTLLNLSHQRKTSDRAHSVFNAVFLFP
jgi:hypothetical protein